MKEVKTCTWQVKIIIYIGICLIVLSNIGWADGHLQIKEKEKQLVLKGKISEALGEYDAHLKGAVEYLVCGRNGKNMRAFLSLRQQRKKFTMRLKNLALR